MNGRLFRCLFAATTFTVDALCNASQAISQSASRIQSGVDTIFILPGSHLDIGFTDLPSRVRETLVQNIEAAHRAAKTGPGLQGLEDGGGGWQLRRGDG